MKDSTIIFAAIIGLGLVLYNRHADGSNGVAAAKQAATIVPLGTATPGAFNGGVATALGGGDRAGTPGMIAASEPSPVLLGTDTAPAEKQMSISPVSSVGVQTLDSGHPLAWM